MADPKRVARALQYQQDKPAWWDAVPVADAPGTVRAPTPQEMSWLDRLNELSAGAGKGIESQLEGYKNMVLHPVDTAQQMYQSGKAVVQDPSLLVKGLQAMGERAMGSPQGFGEVVGENINPRNLLRNLTTTSIKNPKILEITAHHQIELDPLQQLKNDAQNAGSFENFKKGWISDIKHGKYYHVTENPNFQIEQNLGPRDMSSMSSGRPSVGSLMITSDPAAWAEYYGQSRPYISEIDVSQIPYKELKQNDRGMGNEFFIENAKNAKVVKTSSVEKMLKAHEEYMKKLPQNEAELRKIYEEAIAGNK